ncbi:hypothetical protein JTL64_34825, partial [Pseudomonas aeruginosa]|nr:hypothetical protein [Pseudomonas aeruginosa]
LGVVLTQAPAIEVVDALLSDTEVEQSTHEQAQRAANEELAELRRRREELQQQHRQLMAREPQWQTLAECAVRISDHLDTHVTDRASLDAARACLSTEHAEAARVEQGARH